MNVQLQNNVKEMLRSLKIISKKGLNKTTISLICFASFVCLQTPFTNCAAGSKHPLKSKKKFMILILHQY